MQTVFKKLLFVFSALFLMGSGHLRDYNMTLEPTRLSFRIQSQTGVNSARLNMRLDGKVVLSQLCGEKSWAQYLGYNFNQILKKAETQNKLVHLTGSELCPLDAVIWPSKKGVKIKILD